MVLYYRDSPPPCIRRKLRLKTFSAEDGTVYPDIMSFYQIHDMRPVITFMMNP